MSDIEVIVEEPEPIDVLVEPEPETLIVEIEGVQGVAGPPGADSFIPGPPGANFRGAWHEEIEYYTRDLVLHHGTVYYANSYNRDVEPPSTQWDLFVPQGQHPTLEEHVDMGLASQEDLDLHKASVHDKTYLHIQTTPAIIWEINHMLGKRPSVDVTDSAGNVVISEVVYIDDDTLQVVHGAAFAGRAHLN